MENIEKNISKISVSVLGLLNIFCKQPKISVFRWLLQIHETNCCPKNLDRLFKVYDYIYNKCLVNKSFLRSSSLTVRTRYNYHSEMEKISPRDKNPSDYWQVENRSSWASTNPNHHHRSIDSSNVRTNLDSTFFAFLYFSSCNSFLTQIQGLAKLVMFANTSEQRYVIADMQALFR